MDDNLTLIKREFEKLKGQFVITQGWKIERLIAIGEDEMDYYYITYDGRKLTWNTCVGRIMPLKGKLAKRDYDELVRIAKLNHFDQENRWGRVHSGELATVIQNFIKQHVTELMTLPPDHKFLAEPYLTLN